MQEKAAVKGGMALLSRTDTAVLGNLKIALWLNPQTRCPASFMIVLVLSNDKTSRMKKMVPLLEWTSLKDG